MKELGYDIVVDQGRGVVAPAGIPKDHEQFLVEMLRKMTQTKAWAEYAAKNAMTVRFLSGAEYAKYLEDERESLKRVVHLLAPKK
jgi:putative tricarboxylic transport membrane protein